MPVSVVTDTTGYLPRELVDRYGITEVPLYVVFADRTVKETEITDYPAFFEELRRADQIATAGSFPARATTSRRAPLSLAVTPTEATA